jgi:hypothetical protein
MALASCGMKKIPRLEEVDKSVRRRANFLQGHSLK